MYIWEHENWPELTWDTGHLATLLGEASREQGRLLGRMQDLGFDLRREAQLNTLTEDVVRSSEIEGEKLDSNFLSELLATYDFERTEFVYEPGQFALRGGILDIYSFGNEKPYRVELDTDVRTAFTEAKRSIVRDMRKIKENFLRT